MNLIIMWLVIGIVVVAYLFSSFLQFKQRLLTEAISHLIITLSIILLGYSINYHLNAGIIIAGAIFLSSSWFLFFITYRKYKKNKKNKKKDLPI